MSQTLGNFTAVRREFSQTFLDASEKLQEILLSNTGRVQNHMEFNDEIFRKIQNDEMYRQAKTHMLQNDLKNIKTSNTTEKKLTLTYSSRLRLSYEYGQRRFEGFKNQKSKNLPKGQKRSERYPSD